jgi:hypothetical protein
VPDEKALGEDAPAAAMASIVSDVLTVMGPV